MATKKSTPKLQAEGRELREFLDARDAQKREAAKLEKATFRAQWRARLERPVKAVRLGE